MRRAIRGPPASRARGYQSGGEAWAPRAVRFVVPMAIGAMLALLIAPRTIAPALNQQLASEAVASHVRSLMATHLMDVGSTDQHTDEPWSKCKLGFSPPADDFSQDASPLICVRLA